MTPFKRGYRITQLYGNNPTWRQLGLTPPAGISPDSSYYGYYGFKGHEGLDLIPTDEKGNALPLVAGTDNWDVIAVEDGVVVRDVDDPKSGAYGEHIVVLNMATRRAWWYCHLSRNDVVLGQKIKRGDRLGLMGSTGGNFAPHLHLGLRLADANGNAINTNNGYKGFVSPKEPLESFNTNSPFPPTSQPTPPPSTDYKVLYEKEQEKNKQLNGKIIALESELATKRIQLKDIIDIASK